MMEDQEFELQEGPDDVGPAPASVAPAQEHHSWHVEGPRTNPITGRVYWVATRDDRLRSVYVASQEEAAAYAAIGGDLAI